MDVETAETVTIEPAGEADPEAPYGRFANGKPRKSPPKSSSSGPRRGGPTTPKASKRASAKRPKTPDFTKMLKTGVQMVGVTIMGIGARRSRALLADGMAVRMHAEPLAKGLNEVAQASPAVQRVLTQAGPAMPYVSLVTAVVGLGVQIAANHGRHLPGMATEDPEALAQAAEMEMARAAEAEAQQSQQQPPTDHAYVNGSSNSYAYAGA